MPKGQITIIGRKVPENRWGDDGRTEKMQHLDFDLIEQTIFSEDSSQWTQKALAEKFGVPIYTLVCFLRLPAYKPRYDALKKYMALRWAEEGWLQLQDDADSNWDANMKKARAEYCLRMASFLDQGTFGNKSETTVIALASPEDRERKIAELERKMGILNPPAR